MDLLLTHGYFLAQDPKELEIMKPYPPLGLLYLSSYLRSKGFGVEIYDSTFGSPEALFRILETERPATLGIYVNLMTRSNVLAILERALAHGWRLILGGPEASGYDEEHLNRGAENFERMRAGIAPKVMRSKDGHLDLLERKKREREGECVTREFGAITVTRWPTGRSTSRTARPGRRPSA